MFQSSAQELQAEFNQEFPETLHQIELADWGKFGKVRQAQGKELADPDRVSIGGTIEVPPKYNEAAAKFLYLLDNTPEMFQECCCKDIKTREKAG
jgi:hypothetical protein